MKTKMNLVRHHTLQMLCSLSFEGNDAAFTVNQKGSWEHQSCIVPAFPFTDKVLASQIVLTNFIESD